MKIHCYFQRSALVSTLLVTQFCFIVSVIGQDSPLKNGDFQTWESGTPEHWQIAIGAMIGDENPKSKVARIKGPALMLQADASTKAFQVVNQSIDVTPGKSYQLEFLSRTKNVRREGRQHDNCFVGIFSENGDGKVIDKEIVDLSDDSGRWNKRSLRFTANPNAESTKVTIFLSKSGILAIKNMVIQSVDSDANSVHSEGGLEKDSTLVANGDFSKWSNDAPDDWQLEIGARNGGDQPTSQVKQLADGGVSLRGNASTRAWHTLKQSLKLPKRKRFVLAFDARAEKIKRQGPQFNNCYIGVMFFDGNGKLVDKAMMDLSKVPTWQSKRITFAVPPAAVRSDLLIFLSKSGTLNVRNVRIEPAEKGPPLSELMKALKTRYSFSELKKIDWNDLTRRHRAAIESANSEEAFAQSVSDMLAELKDIHVWIELPDGNRIHPNFSSAFRANCDHRLVASSLRELRRYGDLGFAGRTSHGFGVLVVTSLPAEGDEQYHRLIEQVKSMFDAAGFIVDLRRNNGGAEPRAKQIAGLFADTSYIYAFSKGRDESSPDGFGPNQPRQLVPATDKPFIKPVICLIGPGCVSSGEGFALMMKAIKHVTMVGQPTRGASGNPAPVLLSNGIKVWFSRWVSMEPDGTPIESRGVQPDVTTAHVGDGDPTFDKAIAMLTDHTESMLLSN